jgi:hypothetical protein
MSLEDKWKEAEKKLEEFNKSMELIKKYPIKQPIQQTKFTPYNVEVPIQYPESYF